MPLGSMACSSSEGTLATWLGETAEHPGAGFAYEIGNVLEVSFHQNECRSGEVRIFLLAGGSGPGGGQAVDDSSGGLELRRVILFVATVLGDRLSRMERKGVPMPSW
ncbi:hypothetical protein AO265_13105 [Pseudomonas sp. ABAC61]|nr:hypothetical protein AO265_13105 [Pseudomonas sp. ABAC61]